MGLVDGFETGSLSASYQYLNNFQASIVTTPTPLAEAGTYALRGGLTSASAGVTYAFYRTDFNVSPPINFTYYFSRSTTNYNGGMLFGGGSTNNCYLITCGRNTIESWVNFESFVNGSATKIFSQDNTLGSSIHSNNSQRWIRINVDWATNGDFIINFYNDVGTLLGTKTANNTNHGGADFYGWAAFDPDIFTSSFTTFYDAIPLSSGDNASVIDTQKTASGIILTPAFSRTIGSRTLSGTTEENYVHLTWS